MGFDEMVEGRIEHLGQGCGAFDLVEDRHAFGVFDAVGLELGQGLPLDPVELALQYLERNRGGRLDDGYDVEGVGVVVFVEQLECGEDERRQRLVERELRAEVLGGDELAAADLDESGVDEGASDADRGQFEVESAFPGLMRLVDEVADGRDIGAGAGDEVEDRRMVDLHPGPQGLGLAFDEFGEGLFGPADEAHRGGFLLDLLLFLLVIVRSLGFGLEVVDDVFGGLGDHVAAGVESGAAGTPGELLEFADAESAHLPSVELRQSGQEHGADGHVDAHAEGVGARDDEQQAFERELFDETPILRQHSGVVDADAVQQQFAQAGPEPLAEGEALDGCGDRGFLLLGGEVDREQIGREVDCSVLGVGDDVDRGFVVADESAQSVRERLRRVFVVEWDGPGRGGDHGGAASGRLRHGRPDVGRVAQGGGHENELGLRHLEEGHLPGPAPGGIGDIVELVHDDHSGVEHSALTQRLIGQDLCRGADDGSVGVDRGVAGDHADVLGAEGVDEGEELLAHKGLERGRVVGPDPPGEGLVEREESDK